MKNNDEKLRALLRQWKDIEPRPDFEARMLRRLRTEEERASLWQRWFVEPWEVLTMWSRQQALATVGVAGLALVLGISVVALHGTHRTGRDDLALFRMDVFQAAPRASITSSYMEMTKE